MAESFNQLEGLLLFRGEKMDEKEVIVFINEIESHDWNESAFFSTNSVPRVGEEN